MNKFDFSWFWIQFVFVLNLVQQLSASYSSFDFTRFCFPYSLIVYQSWIFANPHSVTHAALFLLFSPTSRSKTFCWSIVDTINIAVVPMVFFQVNILIGGLKVWFYLSLINEFTPPPPLCETMFFWLYLSACKPVTETFWEKKHLNVKLNVVVLS